MVVMTKMTKQMRKEMMRGLNQTERKIVKGLSNLYQSIALEEVREEGLLVTVLSSEHWFGNYGYVGKVKDGKFEFDDLPFWQKKMVMNIMAKENTVFFYVYDNYGDRKAYHLYVCPKETKIIVNKKQDNYFVMLENKQLFDLENSYWFNVEDSYLLRKELTRGYWYDNPQEFYYDFHYED